MHFKFTLTTKFLNNFLCILKNSILNLIAKDANTSALFFLASMMTLTHPTLRQFDVKCAMLGMDGFSKMVAHDHQFFKKFENIGLSDSGIQHTIFLLQLCLEQKLKMKNT